VKARVQDEKQHKRNVDLVRFSNTVPNQISHNKSTWITGNSQFSHFNVKVACSHGNVSNWTWSTDTPEQHISDYLLITAQTVEIHITVNASECGIFIANAAPW